MLAWGAKYFVRILMAQLPWQPTETFLISGRIYPEVNEGSANVIFKMITAIPNNEFSIS